SSTAPPPPRLSTLSLHDALPIFGRVEVAGDDRLIHGGHWRRHTEAASRHRGHGLPRTRGQRDSHSDRERRPLAASTRTTACRPPDRKSTRLNSSHVAISYAVFCL